MTAGTRAPGTATPTTATIAAGRLRQDQALRRIEAQRARLAALALRLDLGGRASVGRHLSARVREDRRFAPVLNRLMQLSLGTRA